MRCGLSPRRCTLKPGQHGFCGVRANRGGSLVTLNYGKGVQITRETIETEAVYHFAPGEPILSLGNIGCMLNCDYCHNWATSQARHVSEHDVRRYSPEQVVACAQRHGIRVLSWTYNDPVVWHEFVLDTARLAREAGLINLYKSAFYITPRAVDELLEVIDIFSISLKSMDPTYYRKLTKGRLEPVLDAIRQVHADSRVHLELSTLMVTDISDTAADARRIADFVLGDLSADVPLHFVRFHPDYKMNAGRRTPIDRLQRARTAAQEAGVHHVYLGNVHEALTTASDCRGCGARLVDRYGLHARAHGLDASGRCARCGQDNGFTCLPPGAPAAEGAGPAADTPVREVRWRGDVRSAHVEAWTTADQPGQVWHRPLGATSGGWARVDLARGERFRFLIAQGAPGQTGAEIATTAGVTTNLHEVYDRAHFPTVPLDAASKEASETSPLPTWSPSLRAGS